MRLNDATDMANAASGADESCMIVADSRHSDGALARFLAVATTQPIANGACHPGCFDQLRVEQRGHITGQRAASSFRELGAQVSRRQLTFLGIQPVLEGLAHRYTPFCASI